MGGGAAAVQVTTATSVTLVERVADTVEAETIAPVSAAAPPPVVRSATMTVETTAAEPVSEIPVASADVAVATAATVEVRLIEVVRLAVGVATAATVAVSLT